MADLNQSLKYSDSEEVDQDFSVSIENQDDSIIWRDWFFNKIEKILDISSGQQIANTNPQSQQPTIKNVTVIFGQAGSGKTFLIRMLNQMKRFKGRVLMSFYCKFTSSSTPIDFIECFDRQIQQIFMQTSKDNHSSSLNCPNSSSSSAPNYNVNFRENLLKLLNSFSRDVTIVNKHQLSNKRLLLLIDSIDLRPDICDLVASNLHALPNWLHVIITARQKRYRGITKMFSGARKIAIDDIKKSNVYNDLMGHLIKHKSKLTIQSATADGSSSSTNSTNTKHVLNKIVHKSNGSVLYVKILLDCFERKIFKLQHLDFIGATLNGLYLAIFTSMFNENPKLETDFKTVFSSIDRINGFKVSAEDLKTKLNCDHDRLDLIMDLLFSHCLIRFTDQQRTAIKLVHSSLFEWLSDIKHCSARFICRSYFMHDSSSTNPSNDNSALKHLKSSNLINQKYISNDNDDSINDISDDMLYEKDRSDSNVGIQQQMLMNEITPSVGIYAEANYSHIGDNRKQQFADNEKYFQKSNNSIDQQQDRNNNNSSKYKSAICNRFDLSESYQNQMNNTSNSFINHIESTTSNNSLKNSRSKLVASGAGAGPAMADDDCCLVDSADDEQQAIMDEHCDLSKTEISKEYLNKLYQKFENALHLCDLKTLRSILSRYSNVIINQNFINGKTPMYWAIKKSNMKLVELFIEFNADVNAVCDPQWGYSSLILALMQHSYDLCELVLENDADVELLDRYSMPPILHAILVNCSPEIIKLLLYWGAHTDFIDETGRSLLHFAANEPKTWSQTISLLLTVGCDEMHKDNNGQTALHMAAANGSLETVEVLVEFGGDKLIHTQDKSGKLALHEAVAKNNFEVCEPLITSKSINFVAHSGNTPLRIAVLSYYLDLAQLLILKGADINYKDADGRSIIYCVVAFTHSTLEQKGPPFFNVSALYKNGPEEYLETAVKTIEFLARFGVDLEIKDLEGRTALHVAAWQGTYAIVDCLIKVGANINAIDAEGRTPLHMCAWNGHIEVVRLLAESGSTVNPVSSTQGASPLLVAAQQGHYETCAYLLQAGSDVGHRDFYGRNAKDVAANCGHKEIVALIETFASSSEGTSTTTNDITTSGSNALEDQFIVGTGSSNTVGPGAGAIKLSKYDSRFYNDQTTNGSNNAANNNNNNAANNSHSVPNKKAFGRKNKKTRSISKLTKMLH